MTSTAPITPPEPDELEISIFGPGFGESIVAHLGWGDWVIVDSCLEPDGLTPVGLGYLRRLGADPATAVKRVVATHWHDDHVKGLAQTVRDCPGAKFICSTALLKKEFVAYTDLWKQKGLTDSPVSELSGVLERITQSVPVPDTVPYPVGFALANRCLWKRTPAHGEAINTAAELHSLSPSDASLARSLQEIAALLTESGPLVKPGASRPNHFSVVLWLSVAGVRCLLGADMEEQDNPCGGWKVIVESQERPTGQASLVKVPHHGSVTGEFEGVWTQMLIPSPSAILSPFRRGKVQLPTPDDASRICGRTSDAFITAGLRNKPSRGRTGSVNRTIQETVRYIRRVNDSFGHVRARCSLRTGASVWSVSCFGDAIPLSALYGGQSA